MNAPNINLSLLLFSMLIVLFSCEKLEDDLHANHISVHANGVEFELNSTTAIKSFLAEVTDYRDLELHQNTRLRQLSDGNNNTYLAVTSRYISDKEYVEITIPLFESTAKTGGTHGTGCTMTCTSTRGCSTCRQVILNPCVEQVCDCVAESPDGNNGGCEARISF